MHPPPALQPAWVLLSYFAGCLGALAVYMVNVTPYLMGVTAPHQHNHAFSLLSAIPTAAAFLGALAGGLLPTAFAAVMQTTDESSGPYGLSLLLAALLLLPAPEIPSSMPGPIPRGQPGLLRPPRGRSWVRWRPSSS